MMFKFVISSLLIAILTGCSSKVAIFENKSTVIFENKSIKDKKIAEQQYKKDSLDCQVHSYKQVPVMLVQASHKDSSTVKVLNTTNAMAQRSHNVSLRQRVFKACMQRRNWRATEEEKLFQVATATVKSAKSTK